MFTMQSEQLCPSMSLQQDLLLSRTETQRQTTFDLSRKTPDCVWVPVIASSQVNSPRSQLRRPPACFVNSHHVVFFNLKVRTCQVGSAICSAGSEPTLTPRPTPHTHTPSFLNPMMTHSHLYTFASLKHTLNPPQQRHTSCNTQQIFLCFG